MMRPLLFVAAAAFLAACATETPYQPRSAESRYGYQEQSIEDNRFRLSFSGNSVTDRETVETYLLYRAAEATLERGYDYFVVAQRDTDETTRLQSYGAPHSRFGFNYWYFSPRHGWSPWHDPFWDEPTSYREITRYEAGAEVAMFRGEKPADDASAYDARQVQSNLQGRIARPSVE